MGSASCDLQQSTMESTISTSMGVRKVDPPCTRKRRKMNDAFFLPGDRLAHKDDATIAIVVTENNELMGHSDISDEIDHESREKTPQYRCPLCSSVLQSMAAWELHYETTHVFQCHICHEIFPCDRLLDFHLEERHDSFFAASLERNQGSYKCLVTTCLGRFGSDKERHYHLMQAHDYPKWFRFHSRKKEKNSTKMKWIEKHSRHVAADNDQRMNMEPDPSKEAKKQGRRQHQKEKRAITTCRFFRSSGGCFRGSKCAFLHVTTDSVDDLTETFSSKAVLSVPEKISFGRRIRCNLQET